MLKTTVIEWSESEKRVFEALSAWTELVKYTHGWRGSASHQDWLITSLGRILVADRITSVELTDAFLAWSQISQLMGQWIQDPTITEPAIRVDGVVYRGQGLRASTAIAATRDIRAAFVIMLEAAELFGDACGWDALLEAGAGECLDRQEKVGE